MWQSVNFAIAKEEFVMKIGLNLLFLLPGIVGGTETYASGLLQGLSRIDSRNEYIIFTNQKSAGWAIPSMRNFKRVVCPISGLNRVLRYGFEQFFLPKLLGRLQIDLVHSLGYVGPLFPPCPSVVTVHDLNYVDVGDTLGWKKRTVLRFFSGSACRRADRVITISEFSKNRLVDFLNLASDKIIVTHEGPDESRQPYVNMDQAILKKYCISKPYIMAFGGGLIHKNIPRLIKAFLSLSNKYVHSLVLVGHMPANVDLSCLGENDGERGRIVRTGYVPAEHIGPLLSQAELFVLPSLYEGFGLPVLEAQQAGAALACSSAGSLPEVAGAGAIFFDPTSVDEIGNAIDRCLSNEALRNELRQLGKENVKRFSWEKTASETLSVYMQILNGRRERPSG